MGQHIENLETLHLEAACMLKHGFVVYVLDLGHGKAQTNPNFEGVRVPI